MIHGIIFDLGSTLMYFEGKWEEVDKLSTVNLVAFLNARGITTPDDFHARFLEHRKRHWHSAEETGFEARMEDALRDTLAELGHVSLDGMLPRAVEVYFELGEQHWHPYPDALEALRVLHARGLHLGLISNADDDGNVQRAVERLDFAPYLNPVLSSAADPRWRKPDPRIFHLIAHAWQLPPAEIAMVGDATRYDIVGAHHAGMRGILIDRGDNAPWQKIPDEHAHDPLWQADAVVRALTEIPGTIEKM